LRFDFYIPEYNVCIEFDGKQHFILENTGWNVKNALAKTQKNDEIKNNFCKRNDIRLIRIPYTMINQIGRILRKAYNEGFSRTSNYSQKLLKKSKK
jgi:very-short-patch-repair endonuclease